MKKIFCQKNITGERGNKFKTTVAFICYIHLQTADTKVSYSAQALFKSQGYHINTRVSVQSIKKTLP